ASRRLSQVAGWFETWESRLSRFRPESELSQLNARAGEVIPVSPMMWQVIQASLRAARISGGLVTPTVLPALEAAGYDRSFDQMRDMERGFASRPSPAADWREIALDPAKHTLRLPQGTRLDLGGIGKGWAAQRSVHRLRAWGATLVSAGGDIALSSSRNGLRPWSIAVADPRDPEKDIARLALHAGGVATSGTDYRRWMQGGALQHHLIDPRTGAPALTDVLSATVIAPSLEMAEVAAKVVILLGSREGLAWIERRPILAGLLVLESGEQLDSRRLTRYLWRG
ncbi:MAG: FAD:protein FMN transferase, partial [Anaerolineales bacterium]|nr:FAD:protein FMN transferase [Anaerolineales bacterium]